MDQSLLLSKFHIPNIKPNLVTRSRLLDLLDEGLAKKVILLSAPAGFGKTTLLANWLRKVSLPSAWLSLDEEDNDFARFLTYLVTALQKLDPSLDNTVLDLLQSPQPGLHSAALTALLNQIEGIKTDSILILDDFHFITEPDIHQAVDYLINYLPINLHLIIGTRADPPLALSRLRARGELLEIRMQALRFTEEEALRYFSTNDLINLSDQSISLLNIRTEGWVSGLQMAGLSLQGNDNAEDFVKSFSGTHKYILDYLLEEVLKGQSSEVQQFLLFTSIFDRLSGLLCNEVLERNDSAEILDHLEKNNLFLIPLDDERIWYRYHQLFKDLLLNRLYVEFAELIPGLFYQASVWHEQNGWNSLAIDYALEAGDFERAADLISQEGENILMRSEVRVYQDWITKLPAEFWQDVPELVLLEVWARILSGKDFEGILTSISEIKEKDNKLTGRVDALMAFVQISKGEFKIAGKYASQALDKIPATDQYFRGLASWIFGVFHALQQNIRGSLSVLEKLSTSMDFQNCPMLRIMILSPLAHAHTRLGNFDQAEKYYGQALETATDKQGNWIPVAGEALMGLGDLYRELNQLDQAKDLILEGIELTFQWRKAAAIEGYLFLARIEQLKNNWVSANSALKKAMELAIEYDAMDIDDRMVAMWQARLWCFEGKGEKVAEWLKDTAADEKSVRIIAENDFSLDNYLLVREKAVVARFLYSEGRYKPALVLINELTDIYEDYGRLDFLIEMHLLRSLIYNKIDNQEHALQALDNAIKLGEQGGFLGLFLECGVDLKNLLLDYEKKVSTSAYLSHLLSGFENEPTRPLKKIKPFDEEISDREMDVLRYLFSNLTTPEIAEEMSISINTVRTHIKKIYQKLSVHKRSEAVNRAKELNII